MRAFVEWLYKPPSGLEGAVGLLRVGPDAVEFGDPYEGAVAFRVEDGVVDCKGLNNYLGQCASCGSQISLSRAHVVAGLRELVAVTGLSVRGTHKGKELIMARIRDAQKPDKTWDWSKAVLLILSALAEFFSGQQQLVDAHDGPVTPDVQKHLSGLGITSEVGDEFQASVRRKGQGKKLVD